MSSTTNAALSNYQLGDLLGRGASGSVYRALNFLTGETVAIKSVSLLTLSPSALPDIMSEIDLLKNLNHPNIVKYKGFARDKDNLFIVLEYCENGSLQTILKKFGKFPESLVAVYISQVLEGLIYLHDQGVIHRDIKGANILTNKDGSVKLADFGVSSRTATPAAAEGNEGKGEGDNEVVGSPYWMAPEVIEQSGASTASDIWSVGCVVVELLEGRPPYGELAPMQALWRIVQEEQMRIPVGASPIVKDFLYHCFQKDPNLRITAKKLLRHPWMLSARKTLVSPPATQPHSRLPSEASPAPPPPPKAQHTTTGSPEADAVQLKVPAQMPPVAKSASPDPESDDRLRASSSGTVRPKKPLTVYDAAVLKVQEWNEALNGTVRQFVPPEKPSSGVKKGLAGLSSQAPMPTRASADSLAAQPSSGSINAQTGDAQQGLMPKNQHITSVLSRVQEKNGEDDWDGDFDEVSFSKLGHKRDESSTDEPDQKTLKPSSHSPVQTTNGWSRHSSNSDAQHKLPRTEMGMRGIQESPSLEDYSDLGIGESASGLESKLANLKLKSKSRKGILHPDDLKKFKSLHSTTTPRLMGPDQDDSLRSAPTATPLKPKPTRTHSTPIPPSPSMNNIPLGAGAGSSRRRVSPSYSLIPPDSPNHSPRSPPASRQNSLRARGSEIPNQVDVELGKYHEDDDDWDGAFEKEGTLITKSASTLQLTKRSNKSWRSAGEEELDPFAGLDDEFDMSEDLEANLLRDKKATLCTAVGALVETIQGNRDLGPACEELVGLFQQAPDLGLEKHFVSIHGMLAVLEVLESRISRDAAVRLLKVVNHIVGGDVDMLESFCLVGGIPVIIPYSSKKHSLETRLEASLFISYLTRSPLTLQMFISCRGLRILVELLDEDYISNRSLILSALEGIGSVFDLQSPTPRNDFARMFVREGILDPLSTGLLSILRDDELVKLSARTSREKDKEGSERTTATMTSSEIEEPNAQRAINVLLLFCQVAQADQRVREAFASRTIVIRLLKACDLLPRKLLVVAVKAIKHLSTSPQLIEVLQNSNALEVLVGLLGKMMKGAHGNEICSHIFQTIFAMCRLSKARQEEAASSGIIPLLKKVILQKSPLKQFALPILCDLANAGKGSRRLLWHNEGLKLYLDLLVDPYWRVSALDAILAWMADETARVEDVLVEKTPADRLVQCFAQSSGVSFEGILDPFLKILRLSAGVTASVSTPAFFRRLAGSLDKSGKAVTKLNLLRITRVICEHHPDRQTLVERFGLADAVERLAKQDEAVLVRELAKEVIPILLFGNVAPKAMEDDQDPTNDRRRVGLGIGTPRQDASGNVRASSMKRTASEGMVETVRGRSDRDRDRDRDRELSPTLEDRQHRGGKTRTQGTSASAETPKPRIPFHADLSAHTPALHHAHSAPGTHLPTRLPAQHAATPKVSISRLTALSSEGVKSGVPDSRRGVSTNGSQTSNFSVSSNGHAHAHAHSHGHSHSLSHAHNPAISRTSALPSSSSARQLSSTQTAPVATPSTPGSGLGNGERPKHKRMISRSQLREVQWQTDENGRLKSVRGPAKTT